MHIISILMKILITGITGQDGIFISKTLNKTYKNLKIIGISRNLNKLQFEKKARYSYENLKIVNIDLLNFEEVNNLLTDFNPDLLFNLSGPSSVYESIKNPSQKDEITQIFDNLTNSLINAKNFCNFFQASTSEMFGLNNKEAIYSETSDFLPNSPYASGKYENHKKVFNLREKYEWNIFSGIMFNHESEFRSPNYLFMKIINSAIKIKEGESSSLTIGSLDICRDWSYAEEIAKGIIDITLNGTSCDYVLGSGIGSTIEQLVNNVFTFFDLDYKQYINLDISILRKNDPKTIISNPLKIQEELGWSTSLNFDELTEKVITNYMARNNS